MWCSNTIYYQINCYYVRRKIKFTLFEKFIEKLGQKQTYKWTSLAMKLWKVNKI